MKEKSPQIGQEHLCYIWKSERCIAIAAMPAMCCAQDSAVVEAGCMPLNEGIKAHSLGTDLPAMDMET